MKREEAKILLPLIKAFSEGKQIQVLDLGKWKDIEYFNFAAKSPDCYRIKPVPPCRPFKDYEECYNEMLKHSPFGVLKSVTNKEQGYYTILNISKTNITFADSIGHIQIRNFMYMNSHYHFADDSNFGVETEHLI